MSTAPTKSERTRAAERIGMDYSVPILSPPAASGATVRGKPSSRRSTSAERRAAGAGGGSR